MKDAIERVWRRMLMMVDRARITVVDDSASAQVLQVRLGADEVKDRTPRLAEWGLSSNPPVGSDCIVLFIGGDRSNGVAIATGNQEHRMRGLQPGEAALHDDQGQVVYISRAGIMIKGAGLPVTITEAPKVTIDAPEVELTGNLTIAGNVMAGGEISDLGGAHGAMSGARETFNSHTHNVSIGGSSATTAQPNQQE